MSSMPASADARQSPRLRLPAMYTLVRVRPVGAPRYLWTGYIYDISLTGMRFELDHALPPGMQVEVRAMLPGFTQTTFHAIGTVIRLHDDPDEPGPVRMGLTFQRFLHHADRRRLMEYFEYHGLRLAA